MVLLPDPDKYLNKPPPDLDEKKRIFFENHDLDQMAKHFIGNNYRFVNFSIFTC
jgi:hypothetical protein